MMMRLPNRLIDVTVWVLWGLGVLTLMAAFCQMVEPKTVPVRTARRSRGAKMTHGSSATERGRGQAPQDERLRAELAGSPVDLYLRRTARQAPEAPSPW